MCCCGARSQAEPGGAHPSLAADRDARPPLRSSTPSRPPAPGCPAPCRPCRPCACLRPARGPAVYSGWRPSGPGPQHVTDPHPSGSARPGPVSDSDPLRGTRHDRGLARLAPCWWHGAPRSDWLPVTPSLIASLSECLLVGPSFSLCSSCPAPACARTAASVGVMVSPWAGRGGGATGPGRSGFPVRNLVQGMAPARGGRGAAWRGSRPSTAAGGPGRGGTGPGVPWRRTSWRRLDGGAGRDIGAGRGGVGARQPSAVTAATAGHMAWRRALLLHCCSGCSWRQRPRRRAWVLAAALCAHAATGRH